MKNKVVNGIKLECENVSYTLRQGEILIHLIDELINATVVIKGTLADDIIDKLHLNNDSGSTIKDFNIDLAVEEKDKKLQSELKDDFISPF